MFNNLFFNFDEYKLEKFQLENLSTSIVHFNFYTLDPISVESKELSKLLKLAVFEKSPLEKIEAEKIEKEAPLVFICQKGKKSKTTVRKAVEKGFKNVYFVKGGINSLLNE